MIGPMVRGLVRRCASDAPLYPVPAADDGPDRGDGGVTSPVAEAVAIAVSIRTLNAWSTGVVSVPPPVPVNAAKHPIAVATARLTGPWRAVFAITIMFFKKTPQRLSSP